MWPLGVAAALFAQHDQPITFDGTLCHPRHVIVMQASLGGYDRSDVIRAFPEIDAISLDVGSVAKQFRKMQDKLGSSRVHLDRAARIAYTPNDPMWPDMWHSRAIKADLAWDLSRGTNLPIVAVIDTGVNTAHPDLAGNIWQNSSEIAGNSVDDDGNGFVDDVNGWDFVSNDPIPNDVNGHGTACAGLVAAVQDNAIGPCGVAPRARIMSLKAGNDSGYFYDTANIGCYLYAANNGARVLSMSFFSDRVSAPEQSAMAYAVSRGVLPIAAAGNDSTNYPYYPGAYENVMSVAALDQQLSKAGFSNFGSWVDVAAPGVSLRSTTASGGYTSGFGGTSGACPQVAGLAALLMGAVPTATSSQVRDVIEDTCVPKSQAPFGEYANYGMVDCQAALVALQAGTWAAKPTVVRWASPLGLGFVKSSRDRQRSVIYGRGFLNGTVRVLNASNVPMSASVFRDRIEFSYRSTDKGPYQVQRNGVTIATIPVPAAGATGYPLIEGHAGGASYTGGFFEARIPDDGLQIVANRRTAGDFQYWGTFRRVRPNATMSIRLQRSYSPGTAGVETIQIYDWASGSYPYGNWVTLASGPTPTVSTLSNLALPDPSRYVDPEGTVYFRLTTTNGLPAGATLSIDELILVD